MKSTPKNPICNRCGAEVPADAPGAICPACLIEQGKSSGVTPIPGYLAPPLDIKDLQALFPQLEILEFIGSGGMGGVYRARQPQLERDVALKLIRLGEAPERHERFLREGKALAQLNHPNIVQVYDSGVTDGLGYFVMEYVDGQSLQAILREETLSPEEAEDCVRQLCQALQYAHNRGITHRDIKPGNILMAADGQVKIADFGLAKALDTVPSGFQLTLSQEQVGTPYYMAPEQRMPSQEADHRADLYALGVVYYEMLTGRLPIGRVEKPSLHCDIDPRLDDLVLGAMDTDPNKRPKSAEAFREKLESIAKSPPAKAMSKASPARRKDDEPEAKARPWKRAALWALSTGGIVGLLVGLVCMELFPKRTRAEAVLGITNPETWKLEEAPFAGMQDDEVLASISKAADLPTRWDTTEAKAIKRLRKHQQILPQPDSSTIRVRFEDPQSEHAITVANQLAMTVKELPSDLYEARSVVQVSSNPAPNIFNRTTLETFFPDDHRIAVLKKILTSKDLINKALKALPDSALDIAAVQERLWLDHRLGTDLVAITFRDESAQRAATIVNTLVSGALERLFSIERERSNQALDTLQRQLNDQEAKVEEARLRMLDLAERYRIIDTGDIKIGQPTRGQILMSSMPAKAEAKAMLAQAKMQLEALEGLEGEELIEAAAKTDLGRHTSLWPLWPHYLKLKHDLQSLRDRGYASEHPQVKKASAQIDEAKERLSEEVAQVVQVLESRVQNASSPQVPNRDQSMDERRKLAEYSEANKEYELQKKMLENMQAKFATEQVDLTTPSTSYTIHEEAEAPLRKSTLPVEVLEGAVNLGRHGLNPTTMLAGSIGTGLLLGLLALFPIVRRRGA